MADVRKVISFSAVDTGVTAMFEKARQASAKYTAAIIEDAKKASASFAPPPAISNLQAKLRQVAPNLLADQIRQDQQAGGARVSFRGGNERPPTPPAELTPTSDGGSSQRGREQFRRLAMYRHLRDKNRRAMLDNGQESEPIESQESAEPAASFATEPESTDVRFDKRQYWRGKALARRRTLQAPTSELAPTAEPSPEAEEPAATLVTPPPGFENTGTGVAGVNPRSKGGGERFYFPDSEGHAQSVAPREPATPKEGATASLVSEEGKDKEKSQAEEMADDLVAEAMAFSEDVKEQTKYIRDKIKELRGSYAQDLQQALVDNDRRKDEALAAAGDDKEKITAASKEFTVRNQDIRKGAREDNLQVKLLQGIIDAVHQSAIGEAETEKRNTEALVEESNESQERQAEEDKEDDGQAAEEEARPAPRKRGFFGTMFGRVDDEYNDVDEEEETEEGGKKGKKEKRGGNRLVGAGLASQTSGALLSATGFAAFASIGGIVAKLIHEGGELEKSGGKMRGMTGVGYEDYDLKGGAEGWLGIGKSSDYGVKRADFMAYSTDLAAKRGYATAGYDASGKQFNSGLEGETNKLMSTEIGFGLPTGYLSGLAKHQSFDTNQRETSGDVQNLIKIMGSSGQFRGGDFSRLAELLETSNQIAEDQSGYLEQINSDKNAGVMAGMSRLGGSFADQRMGARISTVNNALRTPDNDFKQADAYAVLRRQNPQKSFFELQEEQDKGIGAKGYMSGVMKDITSRGGSDDYNMQMVKSRFGLSPSQARRMYEGYKKNPDVFNFEQYTKAAKGGDIDTLGRAKAVTPAIPIGLAKMDDISAKAGDKTIGVLADMAKWVEDKVPAIVGGMKTVGDAASGAAKKLEDMGNRASKLLTKVENKMHWLD